MNKFVIKNQETGKYVARYVGAQSYTTKVENAQVFKSYENAKAHCFQ